MGLKTKHRRLPDTYFRLVREFPLTHLQNAAHVREAQTVMDRLLQESLDEGGQQYIDVLTDLVEAYENEHEPMPDVSESEVLRELMRANHLSQNQLAKKVGISQSTISAVLSGDRSLTKEQIILLARNFRISPAAFLPN